MEFLEVLIKRASVSDLIDISVLPRDYFIILVCLKKSSTTVMVGSNLNAQNGKFGALTVWAGALPCSLNVHITGRRSSNFCADHRIFLTSTNFRRVFCQEVSTIMLFVCDTVNLLDEVVRRLEVCSHRSLRSIRIR